MSFGKYKVIARKEGEEDKTLQVAGFGEATGWLDTMMKYLDKSYEYIIQKVEE